MREECDRLAGLIQLAGYPAPEPGCPVEDVLRLAAWCIEGLNTKLEAARRADQKEKILFGDIGKKGKKHGQ